MKASRDFSKDGWENTDENNDRCSNINLDSFSVSGFEYNL